MTWTDRISNLKTYKIQSDTEEGLTEGLINLFAEIKGDEFEDEPQILIYIDGTNGNLFISAFDKINKKVYSEKAVFVALTEFWEENQNGYDFDEITISALKKAYSQSDKTIFNSKYEVYYQTEDKSNASLL